MAFWPRDQRTDASPLTNAAKEQSRNYPNLEQGLIGAATLSEDRNKHLSWIFASKTSNDKSFQQRLKFGKEVQICPPTHRLPPESPITSIRQRAEQGANFLRTYIPDVEIPEELIRHQLIEDTIRSRELRRFDPYLGSLIDVLDAQSQEDSIIATFASGETSQNLRYTKISCLDPSPGSQPSDHILRSFLTPIQQIVSSSQNNSLQDTNIAVRTYGSTKVLKVDWRSSSIHPTVKEGATFTRKSMNNETVVDMKYSLDGSHLMFVGDAGSAFSYNLLSDTQCMFSFHPSEGSASVVDKDNFWRLSLGPIHSDYFFMSSKNVFHLDKRTHSSLNLFSLPKGKHVFTSIENCHADNILSLCTTNQLVWMDVRFPRAPLLTYAHGREYDRYLSTQTIRGSFTAPTTILTSRNNSLVTVYDVARSSSGLVGLNTVPYCLSSKHGMYQAHVGQQLVERGNFTALIRLSDGAGVTYSELVFSKPQVEPEHPLQMTDIKNKGSETNADLQIDIGPLGRQEFSQVDLQAAYEEIFRKYFEGIREHEENAAEAICQIVDRFPSYLLNKDCPVEYMLTTYDIATSSSNTGGPPAGTDFLTDKLVNSKLGYQALERGKLSPQLVKAPWHISILPTLRKFDKHLSEDPVQMRHYLQKFDLADDEESSIQVRQYEEDARQELITDLALSFNIFSERPPSKSGEVAQTLEVLTEALSLGDEPPPIEFGFLKPSNKNVSADDENDDPLRGLDIPVGVRLLLQGWDTSDPETLIYQDSYNAANQVAPIKFKKSPSQSQSQFPIVNSQRPPTVLTSNVIGFSQPDLLRKTVPKVQSQSHLQPLFELPSSFAGNSQLNSSQEYMASTQILPGPHGGRPNVKKKPAKKRLGGF